MRKNIFLILIVLICILFFPLQKLNAQGVDLGIYPPVFQIETLPPSKVNSPFFIQNFTDQSVELQLILKPFTVTENENGEVLLTEDTTKYPDPFFFKRVRVLDKGNPITSITLSPQQKRDLTLEIDIPNNQEKGEYYFSLVFTSNTQNPNNSSLSVASAGIASNVILSVGPLGKTQGIIEEFSSSLFVTKGPLPFTVRVRNTSGHYITPKGDITIKNMFGQTVGKINLLPVNILSNTIRRIPDSLQSVDVKEAEYEKIKSVVEKNKFPVSVWPEKFLLGRYTATLTLALSEQGPLFRRQIVFYALPTEYILGILTIIGVVIFIVARVKKKIR